MIGKNISTIRDVNSYSINENEFYENSQNKNKQKEDLFIYETEKNKQVIKHSNKKLIDNSKQIGNFSFEKFIDLKVLEKKIVN